MELKRKKKERKKHASNLFAPMPYLDRISDGGISLSKIIIVS